jgi:ElaB/YqjD/DUF883 family membrane-anchored ribosome-binding protein
VRSATSGHTLCRLVRMTNHQENLHDATTQPDHHGEFDGAFSTTAERAKSSSAKAIGYVTQLPETLAGELTRNPYRTLGIAVVVGLGVGILLRSPGSRILVALAASVGVVLANRPTLLSEAKTEFKKSLAKLSWIDHREEN